MSNDGNRIEGLDPIDRLAALQMAKGVKLVEPELKDAEHIARWDHCPPLGRHSAPSPDLTGRTFGRMKVVGPLRGGRPCNGILWVVECSCRSGMYFEIRRSKAINNHNNKDDCCRSCRSLRSKIDQYHYFRSI